MESGGVGEARVCLLASRISLSAVDSSARVCFMPGVTCTAALNLGLFGLSCISFSQFPQDSCNLREDMRLFWRNTGL